MVWCNRCATITSHGMCCYRCGRHGYEGEYSGPYDTELHTAAAHANRRFRECKISFDFFVLLLFALLCQTRTVVVKGAVVVAGLGLEW